MEMLTVLGKSDSRLPMIMDILESNSMFPKINVINNLCLPIEHEVVNPKFNLVFSSYLNDKDVVYALGSTQVKNKLILFDIFNKPKESYLSLVHRWSYISSTSSLGKGCIINANSSVSNHAKIGSFVTLNLNCVVSHHVVIEDFVTLNPGVNVAGHSVIGKGTTIGMGANVVNGVTIGSNVIIGAGSLVNKDIPDNVVAYGSPCKIIRINE